MKKLLLLILLLLISIAGCSGEPMYTEEELSTSSIRYGPADPQYVIEADYDDVAHQVDARMEVSWKNQLDQPLQTAVFNLWPNAVDGGEIEVQNVFLNGEEAEFSTSDTSMTISGISVKSGSRAAVEMEFTVILPELKYRFGWSGRQVSLGNWFPTLAVHDGKGWITHPYFETGESFFSVAGGFDVTFRAPADLEIVATGERQSTEIQQGVRAVRFTAERVRDFAMLLNTPYQSVHENIGGTAVTVYFREGEEEAAYIMIDAARKAFPAYEEWYGEYPWKTLGIASVDYGSEFDGGMEYPQLVMINTPHIEDAEELGVTIAHEIAHQWFYGIVGSDPSSEPWLDESLTTYASYEAYYGQDGLGWLKDSGSAYTITSSVNDFEEEDLEQYGDVMYDDGAKMLLDLREHLGEEVFMEGLRKYVDDRRFGIATTADFIRSMQEVSGENLKPFFTAHRVVLEETKRE